MSKHLKFKQINLEAEMIGKIKGTGSYLPEKIVYNHDLERIVDTSDKWIRERTGIYARHIMDKENVSYMAYKAAEKALENAGIKAEDIDLIIVSTICSEHLLPCSACEVQKMIGAGNATCFDMNAACTGFIYAYNTAQAYIASGMYKTVLIIGSEGMSDIVDWKDRGTCILFGDGAGAAVITAEEGSEFSIMSRSFGDKGEALLCKKDGYIEMDGQAVFKFAVKEVASGIKELLEKNKLTVDDIDLFVLHQANRRIVEAASKRLGADVEKFPMNLDNCGNTSSASIPVLLDQLNRNNELKEKMKIVIAGFGAGLSIGADIIEW